MLFHMLLAALPVSVLSTAPVPRNVRIDGQRFMVAATDATIVLAGPNVVVKGPPYLPTVDGVSPRCSDFVQPQCRQDGSCSACMTFNQADVDFIKSRGWNTIRLGVAWAGAQPRDEDALDPDFLERLHAILDLADRNGLHVLLDNHGDMVGSLGCGNGVPAWFQQKAAPELVGKPLRTAKPYNLVDQISLSSLSDRDVCGDDEAAWAEFAGDPNYNLLNRCCQALNSDDNPPALGFTEISQKTMDYMLDEGPGRDDFVRYWRLMAEAVTQHPSAFGADLMNEPISIRRGAMYETWRACAEAINAVIPDMSVALADTSNGVVSAIVGQTLMLPDDLFSLISPKLDKVGIEMVDWIKQSNTVFYAWHWYGQPESIPKTILTVQALSAAWDVPNFATEFFTCRIAEYAYIANISNTYWHYSSYCNTGEFFGNRQVPADTFGACILGWRDGFPDRCSPVAESPSLPGFREELERPKDSIDEEERWTTSRLTLCNGLLIGIIVVAVVLLAVVGCVLARRSSSYKALGEP